MRLSILGVLFLLSSPGFALNWLNCSSAEGELRRVETEVWGANPVQYFYKGKEIKNADAKFVEESKIVIVPLLIGRGGAEDEIYAIKLTLKHKNSKVPLEHSLRIPERNIFEYTDWVICEYHKDLRLDLTSPIPK